MNRLGNNVFSKKQAPLTMNLTSRNKKLYTQYISFLIDKYMADLERKMKTIGSFIPDLK